LADRILIYDFFVFCKEVFEYKGRTVAVIPNKPNQAGMNELTNG